MTNTITGFKPALLMAAAILILSAAETPTKGYKRTMLIVPDNYRNGIRPLT